MTTKRIVSVSWLDSCGTSDWGPEEGHRKGRSANITSVGFLLRSDSEAVVITQSLDHSNRNADHTVAIPRCAVRRIRKLATVEVP